MAEPDCQRRNDPDKSEGCQPFAAVAAHGIAGPSSEAAGPSDEPSGPSDKPERKILSASANGKTTSGWVACESSLSNVIPAWLRCLALPEVGATSSVRHPGAPFSPTYTNPDIYIATRTMYGSGEAKKPIRCMPGSGVCRVQVPWLCFRVFRGNQPLFTRSSCSITSCMPQRFAKPKIASVAENTKLSTKSAAITEANPTMRNTYLKVRRKWYSPLMHA